jgi:hypothetical protein
MNAKVIMALKSLVAVLYPTSCRPLQLAASYSCRPSYGCSMYDLKVVSVKAVERLIFCGECEDVTTMWTDP